MSFTTETEFTGKKDELLSRNVSKQRLVHIVIITSKLRNNGYIVKNSPDDADVDIAKAAVDASRHNSDWRIF